ncbi:hypothetical protein [Thomasclavelia cocleata]|uniref:hypothetical protein n=1 Tax=Thomasclavelia cocleata TaxID=69824 RepID=UPI00255AD28D|nr:hypothetical protein [Thomasclavelia cocleata]
MKLLCYIEKVLLNVNEIKNIEYTIIDKEYINEIYLKKLIKCWKDNIDYDIYFEELFDYIDIESFSDTIIDFMIQENVGVEKISHMPFEKKTLSKLACVNEDAAMRLFEKLYTDSIYSAEELQEHFIRNYSDNIYEYLCILNSNSCKKETVIDYIAYECSILQSIKTMVCKRAKARSLRYEMDNDILSNYIAENEYIYNLAIAQNIFASEQILRNLMEVKGLRYCKEIKKRAKETLERKLMITKLFV